MNSAAQPSAARLCRSWRRASRHGGEPARTGGEMDSPPASSVPAAPAAVVISLDPELVDEHVELLAELVVADPLGEEVDQFGGEDRYDRGLLHDGLVDVAPLLVGLRLVGLAEFQRGSYRRVD